MTSCLLRSRDVKVIKLMLFCREFICAQSHKTFLPYLFRQKSYTAKSALGVFLPICNTGVKMAVMTYKCVHGTTADYLADYIRPPSSATANLHLMRSTSFGRLSVPRSKTAAARGPIHCSCWSTLVEQSAYLYHIGRLLGHLQKTNEDIFMNE